MEFQLLDQALQISYQPGVDTLRLPGRLEDRHPQVAVRVDLVAAAGRDRNRDVHEPPVPAADDHRRPARHRGVHRRLCQPQAVHGVPAVGGHAADRVPGIHVPEAEFLAVTRQLPNLRHTFLMKRPGGSVLCRFDLSGARDKIAVISARFCSVWSSNADSSLYSLTMFPATAA